MTILISTTQNNRAVRRNRNFISSKQAALNSVIEGVKYSKRSGLLPKGEQVPQNLKSDGRQWQSGARKCYKCAAFIPKSDFLGVCDMRGDGQLFPSADLIADKPCLYFLLRPDVRETGVNYA